jgi:hypothetical protein
MIERCCQAGVTVATRNDFSIWPDLETDLLERTAIFLCAATGKENSSPINLLWQLRKNHAQTLGRREAKIRRGQFSLVDHVKLPTRIIPTCRGYRFYEYPGGFRAAAFDPENALAGFHHFLRLAVLARF